MSDDEKVWLAWLLILAGAGMVIWAVLEWS